MDPCIVRQPILTKDLTLFAYRLEFRSGLEQAIPSSDPALASAQLIAESVAQLGLQELTGGARAVIPVTRNLLVGGFAAMLPKHGVVVEVDRGIPGDAAAMAACAELKRAGYRISVAISTDAPAAASWADILTADAHRVPLPDPRPLKRRAVGAPPILLATNVDTQAVCGAAVAAGYDLVEGSFFTRPALVRGSRLPAYRLRYLALLEAVLAPEIDVRRVADLIERDVTLAYRLLRYINSAFFALPRTVRSVRDALLLLGDCEVRRWACLINLAAIGERTPAALVAECAVRGRMCELLASDCSHPEWAHDCFFVGLFSMIDALLDRPLPAILQDFPLAVPVKAALLGVENPLWDILTCVLAYTGARWDELTGRLIAAGAAEAPIGARYREAIAWTQDVLPVAETRKGDSRPKWADMF